MRTMLLLAVAMMLLVGTASASVNNWVVECGLGDNIEPASNDFRTIFGVAPTGTYADDGDDAVHPLTPSPQEDLHFIYTDAYTDVYDTEVLHSTAGSSWTTPVGWPPPWGGHGDGAYPEYRGVGLIKDTRAPITEIGQPEIWRVKVHAPQAGQTCSFIWNWNVYEGFEAPANMDVRIWGNADLEAVGISGDLVLSDWGVGDHKITGIPQWGVDDNDNPISHTWVIQATLVPEPAVAQLAGLVLGIAGLGIARLRRK